jgi:hypothetical protein
MQRETLRTTPNNPFFTNAALLATAAKEEVTLSASVFGP